MFRLASTAICSLAVTTLVVGPAGTAHADDYVLGITAGMGAYPRTAPAYDARTGTPVPEGTLITGLDCYEYGQDITNQYGYTSPFWLRDDSGHYWSEAWLSTGANGLPGGIVECSAIDDASAINPALGAYDGDAAATWARGNVEQDERFANADCTWFLSQALATGGLPQSDEWSTPEYDDPPSTAILAHDMFTYLSSIGDVRYIDWTDNTAQGAEVGDVIAYDWDNGVDGSIDHLSLVTWVDDNGYPYVTQHTPAQVDRFWSYSESAHEWIEVAKEDEGGAQAILIDLTP